MAAPIDNVFVRELERNDGVIIKINQSKIGDVGCVVWDAALVLSKYLETDDFDGGKMLEGMKVIELGSGTGAVGLMAGSYGADVTMTDLPEFIPLIQLNIDTNKNLFVSKVTATALPWGRLQNIDEDYDIILLADCIYYDESLEPLVNTVDQLCSDRTIVYCSYEERSTGNKPELQRKFFQLVRQKFNVEEIPHDKQDTHFRSEDIHIMKFRKKCNSDR
ncbi:hypothetical protein CHS0354_023156 [Potamilus streckersoni]|uniref:Uncharacterized protein n=1 Tax=Potamilus streckersoni TaxID=2493646 RepID=A0AAE0RNC6_9BIVA|nr:hypothetical protein CHS0354_023156 [Potamilus streckersoni]